MLVESDNDAPAGPSLDGFGYFHFIGADLVQITLHFIGKVKK
ncbi:hypothetical protein J504_2774 [Acinetobacter baumannii 348935]|nr:hypothetical protein J504_2774 [Acinetobacter baumannii 348935]